MTEFFRLIDVADKESVLRAEVLSLRTGKPSNFNYSIRPDAFSQIPGSPFAYWVSERVRKLFRSTCASNFLFKPGIASGDDFRFLRSWWESHRSDPDCVPIAKGGDYSPFYQDLDLIFRNKFGGREFLSFEKCQPRNMAFFGRPGITWPFRTAKGLNTRALPTGCAFTIQGMAGFDKKDNTNEILFLLGVTNSSVFKQLLLLSVGAFAFQAGAMSIVPIPKVDEEHKKRIAEIVRSIWQLKYKLDSICETSHAFRLPYKIANWDFDFEQNTLLDFQEKLDQLVYKIFDLHEEDKLAIKRLAKEFEGISDPDEPEFEGEAPDVPENVSSPDLGANLLGDWSSLSWAVGVVFGRFDLRLATGERKEHDKQGPFDPLPAKSPGMLPDSIAIFHSNSGILVDEPGHPHDLSRLIEEVIARVQDEVPGDVRRWLQKDFFPMHMKQYSKSRRKAPIYWPLSTTSGSYTLWLYYPSLNSQTLYTAINDLVEPKLQQVGVEVTALRKKGTARQLDDEKKFETLLTLELELIELRDNLLKIAPTYQPSWEDGVQISAAPLWPLFRYQPWQLILKDTWTKLEAGEYDWAYLAMNYWPERVREKSKNDKSLAIAHGLEQFYVEPAALSKKTRGRKRVGGDE